jgi:hypothetical protein
MRRLLARPALAVDGGGGHRLVEARRQHRVPGDVHALIRHLAHAAEDHIIDLARLEAIALEHGYQHLGGQIDRMQRAERAARLAAPRRGADDVDDHSASDHGYSHCMNGRISSCPLRAIG